MFNPLCELPGQFNMRRATGIAVLAFVGACATTPDDSSSGFTPPPVGTEIDWSMTYANGAREDFTSRMVANGDDFGIYLADTELAGDEPYHYYAEFAGGVFYASCGDPMPTMSERAAVMDLWPLDTGATADVGGGIQIGSRESVTVNDQLIDVVWSNFSYRRDGRVYTDRFAVAPEHGLVIRMRQDLDDGYADGIVRELRFAGDAETGSSVPSRERLGSCEGLL